MTEQIVSIRGGADVATVNAEVEAPVRVEEVLVEEVSEKSMGHVLCTHTTADFASSSVAAEDLTGPALSAVSPEEVRGLGVTIEDVLVEEISIDGATPVVLPLQRTTSEELLADTALARLHGQPGDYLQTLRGNPRRYRSRKAVHEPGAHHRSHFEPPRGCFRSTSTAPSR